jgi:hypothetical protein
MYSEKKKKKRPRKRIQRKNEGQTNKGKVPCTKANFDTMSTKW